MTFNLASTAGAEPEASTEPNHPSTAGVKVSAEKVTWLYGEGGWIGDCKDRYLCWQLEGSHSSVTQKFVQAGFKTLLPAGQSLIPYTWHWQSLKKKIDKFKWMDNLVWEPDTTWYYNSHTFQTLLDAYAIKKALCFQTKDLPSRNLRQRKKKETDEAKGIVGVQKFQQLQTLFIHVGPFKIFKFFEWLFVAHFAHCS